MINENFIWLGLVFVLVATLRYASEVIKGNVKPNRVTYLMWTIAPFMVFFGQLSEDVGIEIWYSFAVGAGPALILAVSFLNKESYWKLQRRDYIFGLLSLAGLVLWQITGEGLVAIIFGLLADMFAGLPTLLKAYSYPETEDTLGYLIVLPATIITLLILDSYSFVNVIYPLYIALFVTTISILIHFEPGKKQPLKS